MRKRNFGILFFALIVIFVISFISHNVIIKYQDIQLWKEFRDTLNSDNISTVSINGFKSVSLQDDEKNTFIDVIKKSSFFKSNRELAGTTGAVILINYTDGKEDSITCSGGSLFELYYKKLHFFVKNAELKKLLDHYDIKW